MKQILIIDDSKGFLETISELLERTGYQVLTATNGREGIRLFNSTRFDLILTDINMPGMDGNLVAENIRKSANYEDTPIVAVTGSSREVKNDLFDDVIRKPFSSKKLLSTIESFI
ncbi:response regulator [Thermodesulfobacteriota bacterium]